MKQTQSIFNKGGFACSLATALTLIAGSASAAVTDLIPAADTAIAHRNGNATWNSSVAGSYADLDNYSFSTTDLNIMPYIRFDMSSLGNITINSATLTLTKAASNPTGTPSLSPHDTHSDSMVTGRIDIFGLNNVVGNTPQNWDEATLSWDNTGAEQTWPFTGDPFNSSLGNSTSFAGLESVTATTVTLTGVELVSFLQTRANDGGLATLMTWQPSGGGKGWAFDSKESTGTAPTLTIDYTVVAVPEPGTFSMLLGGVGLLALVRRNRRIN